MLHCKTGQIHSISYPKESQDLTVLQNLCYSNFSDLSIKSETSNNMSHFSRHGHCSCLRRDHLKSYQERNVAGIMLPWVLQILRHAHMMVIESFITARQQWSTMLQSQEGWLCQQRTRYDETNIVIVDNVWAGWQLFPLPLQSGCWCHIDGGGRSKLGRLASPGQVIQFWSVLPRSL